MTPRRKRLLAIVVPAEVVLAVAAWRDLARRPEELVRGSKKLWRRLVLLNPGNSVLYWLFGRRRTPLDLASRARRIGSPKTVTAGMAGSNVSASPDFTCAFEIDVPAGVDRNAEEWLRATIDGAPEPVRLFLYAGWTQVLRLRLDPRSKGDAVLGWKVVTATEETAVCVASGPLVSAEQVLSSNGSSFVHTTNVHFERGLGRVLWAAAEPIHVAITPHLMHRAVTSH